MSVTTVVLRFNDSNPGWVEVVEQDGDVIVDLKKNEWRFRRFPKTKYRIGDAHRPSWGQCAGVIGVYYRDDTMHLTALANAAIGTKEIPRPRHDPYGG